RPRLGATHQPLASLHADAVPHHAPALRRHELSAVLRLAVGNARSFRGQHPEVAIDHGGDLRLPSPLPPPRLLRPIPRSPGSVPGGAIDATNVGSVESERAPIAPKLQIYHSQSEIWRLPSDCRTRPPIICISARYNQDF